MTGHIEDNELIQSCVSADCKDATCAIYCSPPEVLGTFLDRKASPVTFALDVFACGCLLFEMLAGWRPFGSQADQAMKATHMPDQAIDGHTETETSKPERDAQKRELVKEQHRQWVGPQLLAAHLCPWHGYQRQCCQCPWRVHATCCPVS